MTFQFLMINDHTGKWILLGTKFILMCMNDILSKWSKSFFFSINGYSSRWQVPNGGTSEDTILLMYSCFIAICLININININMPVNPAKEYLIFVHTGVIFLQLLARASNGCQYSNFENWCLKMKSRGLYHAYILWKSGLILDFQEPNLY